MGYSAVIKTLTSRYNVFTITTYQNTIGALFFLPLFVFFEGDHFMIAPISGRAIMLVLLMSVFASTLAFLLFSYSIRGLGINKATVFNNAIPVITTILAIIILHGVELVDATCPIVLKLQQRVADAYAEMKKVGGRVVIYGKKGHPEVIGLMGNAGNEAVVISSADDIALLDLTKPMVLFSQTTMDAEDYQMLIEAIHNSIRKIDGDASLLRVVNSVCGSVSNRRSQLKTFALSHGALTSQRCSFVEAELF